MPKPRSNALAGILRTMLHNRTTDRDALNALYGFRRLVDSNVDGFVDQLLKQPVAAPTFEAPSYLMRKNQELAAQVERLVAENDRLRHVPPDTSMVRAMQDKLVQERQRASQERQQASERAVQHNRAIHRLATKAGVACPCDACKQKNGASPKKEKGGNQREGYRRIWSWDRYQFLAAQRAKLGLQQDSKYFDKSTLAALALLCSERFQLDMTPNAIIGALDRLRRHPDLAKTPVGSEHIGPMG